MSGLQGPAPERAPDPAHDPRSSRVGVPAPPVPGTGVIGEVLRRAAREGPHEPLLSAPQDPDRPTWTATQLLADAERVAYGLLQWHEPGSRVATLLSNGAEAALLQLGCALAGMVLVPLNPRLPVPEQLRALARTTAVEVFAAVEVAGIPVAGPLAAALAEPDRPMRLNRCDGTRDSLPAPDRLTPRHPLPEVRAGDLAQVQFTSGTSGRPKGVLITHGGMVATSQAFVERLGPAAVGGAWLNPMPLFHTAGNVLGVLGALWARAEHVVFPFDAGRTLAQIEGSRAALLSAAPTLLVRMLEHPDLENTALDSLQVVFTGGQSVAPEFVDRVESAFGARLSIAWGMTETCGCGLLTAPGDPDEVRRVSLGRPLPGTEIRVVDEAGGLRARGLVGELLVRGERLTRGYLDDPDATAAAIDAEGWLHTGDLAVMTSGGKCRVVGRSKDMIKSGGENVAPDQVEAVIIADPSVKDAAVVGVADERWGELVVACVTFADGLAAGPAAQREVLERLERRCRSDLAPHQRPRRWMVLQELPRTASSKIQRAQLRLLAARET